MSTFEFAPQYRIGNEAIAYQNDSSMHSQLSQIIVQMRAVAAYSQDIQNRAAIEKVIFDTSGISIRLDVVTNNTANAGVYIPDLDKNHPIINNYVRGYRSNADLTKVMNFTNGKFTGVVDKKNGKFLGDFSKIRTPVYITSGLLANEYFSPGEVATAIMHEVGHIATYFERLLDITSLNYAAVYVAERVLKTGTDVERIKLVTEFEKATNTELKDKETIISSENGMAIYTHLVFEATRQRRNEEGDEIYSYRGFEFSSDQFVTRHGAGRDLATLIAKIDGMQFGRSSRSWVLHVAIQLFFAYIAVLLAMGVGGAISNIINTFANIQNVGISLYGIFLLLSLTDTPTTKIYDDPKERINRIRNEMVGALKETTIPQEREIIVKDIAFLEEATKNVIDKPTWVEFIKSYLPTDYRKAKNSRDFQQNLEKLMNNDLFLASATLEATV